MTGTRQPYAAQTLATVQPHLALTMREVARVGLKGVVTDVRDRRREGFLSKGRGLSPRRLDPRVRRPVFVLGAPRSGTTFLGAAVGKAPGFSYHFEPRLTKAAARQVYDGSWEETRATRTFRGYYSALLLASGDGGLRFAEKNPENCFILPFLARVFPDAQFVQILRDGRDATVSHAEKPWLRAGSAGSGLRGRSGTAWGPYPRFWVEPERHEEFAAVSDIERSAWCWRRFTEAMQDGLAQVPAKRVLRMRYESLVSDPAAGSQQLADFLDIPTDQREPLAQALGTAQTTSVGRWRSALSAGDVAAVERQCTPLLHTLGYLD